jgi:hypothetical protein
MKSGGGFRLDLGQDISCFCFLGFGVEVFCCLNLHSKVKYRVGTEGLDDSRVLAGKVGIGKG